MPTFKNLKDLEIYLKKNPDKDKGKCSNCGSEIHINVTVD